nr:immunoglobulin light chain junction region [Macaca mulatta]MOX41727.1 immunoglobulin light chain junction region [Macaca mulatta]MOX42081.1 immunoglobulin light chain junction region [Macaca mulatta]MOX42279.1 immunoglobulin light chain junction region [Macaca mulatta]MOX42336.1 immunoglobulin light chain junction region [Macaca mulatta]
DYYCQVYDSNTWIF